MEGKNKTGSGVGRGREEVKEKEGDRKWRPRRVVEETRRLDMKEGEKYGRWRKRRKKSD